MCNNQRKHSYSVYQRPGNVALRLDLDLSHAQSEDTDDGRSYCSDGTPSCVIYPNQK